MIAEPLEDVDVTTRQRALRLIIELGPITAANLAERLDLTSAAVRRHLTGLEHEGQILSRDDATQVRRGRGRPAKRYIATAAAHTHFADNYARIALQALGFLSSAVGPQAVVAFAEERSAELQQRYAPVIAAAGDDMQAKTRALAAALGADGYAATSRPVGGNVAVQLCQGHCPVREVATNFPQLCEAETRAFSSLLGVHVQRLSTLAAGGHVCTTHIPVTIPTRVEGK